jgi:hypothetical protein
MVLVPISWAVTLAGTPGFLFNAYLQGPAPQEYDGFKIAAVVDFAVWFAALWGFQKLWAQLRAEIPEQRHASPAVGALLSALPLSFYLAVEAAMVLNRGRLPDSGFFFLAAIVMSLAVCAVAISGLFALAVKCWRRS